MTDESPSTGPRIKPVRLALALSVIALVVYASQFMASSKSDRPGIDLPKALISTDLSAQPTTANLQLEQQSSLQVWAVIDMSHPDRSPNDDLEDFPQALEYVIAIGGTTEKTLRCNPFATNHFQTYHKDNSMGRPWGQQYDGRLKKCAVTLPAGDYTFTMHVEKKIDDPKRFTFRRHAIAIREME